MQNLYIKRPLIRQLILKNLQPKQAVILYGARRVGKTTLLEHLKNELDHKIKWINADKPTERTQLSEDNFHQLQQTLTHYDYLIIDEAQKIQDIGNILKMIVDTCTHLKVLVTGSASFELANQIGEPLTGRKRTFTLYPISICELFSGDPIVIDEQLEERLIYGSYPKLFSLDLQEKKEELHELADAYLYRDILALENIRNSDKIRKLLVLLALQVGSEVSLNELSNHLGLHIQTVSRYLNLLEKVFVIFRLGGFSRNLRKEIRKNCKYYFYDNGIRNAIINNFNPLSLRDDKGKLWENFLISERIKLLDYHRQFANRYFWRTYDQKEIDLIEERDGHLYSYEIKYGNATAKRPKLFLENYKNSSFGLINQKNYIPFLTDPHFIGE